MRNYLDENRTSTEDRAIIVAVRHLLVKHGYVVGQDRHGTSLWVKIPRRSEYPRTTLPNIIIGWSHATNLALSAMLYNDELDILVDLQDPDALNNILLNVQYLCDATGYGTVDLIPPGRQISSMQELRPVHCDSGICSASPDDDPT